MTEARSGRVARVMILVASIPTALILAFAQSSKAAEALTPRSMVPVPSRNESSLEPVTKGSAESAAQLPPQNSTTPPVSPSIRWADFVNNRIFRANAKTKRITTIAGNGLPHRLDEEL